MKHTVRHCFDPAAYVRSYYSGRYENVTRRHKELLEWAKDTVHALFAGGKYSGEHLLDIGSGPVAYTAIAASEWFDEIYLSDLSPANVEFQRKWIRGESEHMQYFMKEYALKDGKGEMLKPGGHFIVVDIMDQVYYVIQDKKFSLFVTTEQDMKTAFTESGFQIENFGTKGLGGYPEAEVDCEPLTGYFIIGKKL